MLDFIPPYLKEKIVAAGEEICSETADLNEELFEWVAQAYAFAQYK